MRAGEQTQAGNVLRIPRKDRVQQKFVIALGALCAGGYDWPVNRLAALEWFRAAAARGHGVAQMMLGRYLLAGVTGDPALEEGRMWLERAAAQGITEAEQDLLPLTAQ